MKWDRYGAAMMTTAIAGSLTCSAFDIPRLKADNWDRAFRVDMLVPVDTPLRRPDVFSASARLGWDDEGLRVQVTVVGVVSNACMRPEELWKGDSVEIYLAPSADSPDRCQWVLAPGLDPSIREVRTYLHDYRQAPSLKSLPSAVKAESRRTANGYQMEARLPWSALAIEPKAGREVCCQIFVSNYLREGEPQDHLVWYPMYGAYSDSRKMCRLRLARAAGPAVRARGVARLDLWNKTLEINVLAPAGMAGRRVGVRGVEPATLVAGQDGYAHASLKGPLLDQFEANLEVDGEVVDIVPLQFPAVMSPARRLTLETRVEHGIPLVPADSQVRRRSPGGVWEEVAANGPIERRTLYEYAVARTGDYPAVDYLYTGLEVPAVERRGTAVLVVEQTLGSALEPELRRLLLDWVGDGWNVVRYTVAEEAGPMEVKRLIQAQKAEAVLLLGRVPVPYSGVLRPDGHPDHCGAWPADVFYATGDDGWTDREVNHTNADVSVRQHNVPGDGKYDQSEIPSPVLRAVGRVDFRGMPVFPDDEVVLTRRYLDRLHAYRQCQLPVVERGWVQDTFYGHAEHFAYSGWQNLSTLLGADGVSDGKWPNFPAEMQLWFAGCGSGGSDWMNGFGHTHDLLKRPLNAVFTLLFGSYFGDWALENNLMRGVMASDGGALTCGWAGRPHWYLHPMGMGATIGECLMLTQNNGADGYRPTGSHARGVHIALLGDPTLRMHRVAPPADLKVTPAGRRVRLSWRASPQAGARYWVYRATAETGPYERLNESPLASPRYSDTPPGSDVWYMVRAAALRQTPTGSYENMSQGLMRRHDAH